MFDLQKFAVTKAKPLPVYLLLDVSTTMAKVEDNDNLKRTGEKFFKDGQQWEVVEGGTTKMDSLNNAVEKMLSVFVEEEKMDTEIILAVITFGDDAKLVFSPTKVSDIIFKPLIADGETSMGAALKMAKDMIEDKTITPSRAYVPTIVLVSDGHPNDDNWEQSLDDFINSGRSQKCDRMAMAIGSDADKTVLKSFIKGTAHKLFFTEDATKINEFFERVTMSVTTRSRSQNPNQVPLDEELETIRLDTKTKSSESNKDDSDDYEW
jgi:uncharacterized protein YegL